MNLLAAWKKVLLFGLFGAAGCLAGWAVGEGYLLAARAADPTTAPAGTLTPKPSAPPTNAPPPPEEFQTRLLREGTKTGDVQVSLIWFNKNDLDLHCKAPGDEREIYSGHPISPSEGELDASANRAGSPLTAEPVENIYWPRDRAPAGKYAVSVNYAAHNPDAGAPNETAYKVTVLYGGVREVFSGTIAKTGTAADKRLIFEFQVHPKLELLAPAELELPQNSAARVPVLVRRTFYKGEIKVRAENLPGGVAADPITIPAGMTEGEIVLRASGSAKRLKTGVKLVAAGTGDVNGSADAQLTVAPPGVRFAGTRIVLTGLWTAILAVGLALGLVVGQNRYLKRPPFAAGRVPLVAVVLGAVLAGFVSGSVGQALDSVLPSVGAGGLGLVVGWVLLGGLLGWGVGFCVANLDGRKAVLAGVAGGLLGGAAYLACSAAADWLGRLAGAGVFGFCLGLVAAVEAAFRRSWLEVRFGERERITVNLGDEPVTVGGDARVCTVWARGAPAVALRYSVCNGRVICEDTQARSESVANDGHARAIGPVTVVVRTGESAGSAPPALVQSPPPRVRPPLPPVRPPVPAPTAAPAAAPAPAPPKPPAPKPASAPAPVAKAPPAKTPSGFGGGLPTPVPPPPARPAVKSILDDDGFPPARVPVAPKPPAPAKPAAAAPVKSPPPVAPASVAKPPVPGGAKPPTPVTPVTKPATPPAPELPAPPPVAPTKPPVPAAAKPPTPTKPTAAAPPKPAVPSSPKPPAPVAGAKKSAENTDACPTCGRAAPGRPGARYCMMCEKTF